MQFLFLLALLISCSYKLILLLLRISGLQRTLRLVCSSVYERRRELILSRRLFELIVQRVVNKVKPRHSALLYGIPGNNLFQISTYNKIAVSTHAYVMRFLLSRIFQYTLFLSVMCLYF